MIISELITLLRAGKLKNVAVGTDEVSVIGYINLAILEIHKRFDILVTEAVVTLVDGTLNYTLDGIDANVSIDLSDKEFLHILSITSVNEEGKDVDYLINQKQKDTVVTPTYNSIKLYNDMYEELYEKVLTVTYKASPKFILVDTEIVPLPLQFINAACSYVAYEAQSSIKGGSKDENNTHFVRFEDECDRLNLEGLFNDDDLSSSKFEKRGFC